VYSGSLARACARQRDCVPASVLTKIEGAATDGRSTNATEVAVPGLGGSARPAGMHHLGVGASNAYRRVLAIADQTTVTVIDLFTGEVLSTHNIDPDRNYSRNQQKRPGRWPGRNQ
jgi:hypothetical protein